MPLAVHHHLQAPKSTTHVCRTILSAKGGIGRVFLLADLYYILTHHPISGKPAADPKPLAVATAAALLGELVITEAAMLREDHLTHLWSSRQPADGLDHILYERLCREPRATPQEWIIRLSEQAVAQVGERLMRMGMVYPATVKPWFGQPVTSLSPANPEQWEGALAHLRVHMFNLTHPDPAFTAAAALLHATGTAGPLLTGMPRVCREHLGTMAGTLTPALYQIIAAAGRVSRD